MGSPLNAFFGGYPQEKTPDDFLLAFNAGLELAARLADSWADECCGGSGEGGEGYRNLAKAIRAKQG